MRERGREASTVRARARALLAIGVLAALLASLAGCGSSSPPTVAAILVRSRAVAGEVLAAKYTCDGQDVSPPLAWGDVPADIKQLALFVVGFPTKVGTRTYKASEVSVEWAVAGLNPSLHALAAGQLPAGAYEGLGSAGRESYSVCPAKGTGVHYQFELYGVPSAVKLGPRFSGKATLATLNDASGPTRANAHGGFPAVYTRP